MNRLRALFSIDLRSIALFRIALSLVLLIDLGIRAEWLEAWYTDFGLLPVAGARVLHAEWSVHTLSGSLNYEIFLFALAAIAAICLGLGFHSRFAIFACYILGVSLIHRNPAVQGGTGSTVKLVLFWSLWLPLGARWSIDRLRHPAPKDEPGSELEAHPSLLFSVATVVFIGQIILIYPMLFWGKMHNPCCWRDLSAVRMVIMADRTSTWATRLLREAPWTHKPLAVLALISEGVVPFFAFSPVNNQRLRTATAFAMMFFHGVALPSIIDIGFTFPGIFTALWTLFLPPWFWDSALPRARAWLEARIRGLGPLLSRASRAFEAILLRIPPAKETNGSWRTSTSTLKWKRAATTLASSFIALCFAVVVFESASKVVGHAKMLPAVITHAEKIIGVQQGWSLYSKPPENRAFSYVAELKDGTRVDLFRDGAEVDWDNPRRKPSTSHEVKYQTNLINEGDTLLPFFVAYLARDWDRDHPDDLVETIDVLELKDGKKRGLRRNLLWHREFSERVIPDLDHDWHALAFRPREKGRVQIVIGSSDLTERVCKMKKSVAGLSCNADTDDQLLRPFTRVEGTPFLAPDEPLAPFVDAETPFAVECTLKIVGKARHPKVRFERDTPWFNTTDDWAVGKLSECSPLPSFDGTKMKESPDKPRERATSQRRKGKQKELEKKKKKSRCPTQPCGREP